METRKYIVTIHTDGRIEALEYEEPKFVPTHEQWLDVLNDATNKSMNAMKQYPFVNTDYLGRTSYQTGVQNVIKSLVDIF